MKIALIGYGKMGQAIEQVALHRGHSVSFRISSSNAEDILKIDDSNTDIAIEFTNPGSALKNIRTLLSRHIKTVSGSTGWTDRMDEALQLSRDLNISFLWASNFSLGVNLFFELNTYLAGLMAGYRDYHISIDETHHTQKKDAPSGTAVTLAEQILKANNHYEGWVPAEQTTGEHDGLKIIPVHSYRIDPAPGTHTIRYSSDIDDIDITHTARSRDGFALGAVVAAEYLYKKPAGVYTMKDVLFKK